MTRDEAYRKAEKKIEQARLKEATKLNLNGMKLTELPESLGNLTQLQLLNLGYNELTELPESFGQLAQLQELNLEKNKLTELPESLGQLTQLQLLNLGYNKLTELPESFGQLTQLQKLSLHSNQLTELPVSLGLFTQLQDLDISGNKLEALPKWLGALTGLRKLDVSYLDLTEVPVWLAKFSRLKYLTLHENEIHTVPPWFGQLDDLTEFSIGGNPIGTLSSSIRNLNKLKQLNLWDCNLHAIPEWIGEISSLTFLNFINTPQSHTPNKITDIPISLLNLNNLSELRLDDNPLNLELAEANKQGFDAVMAYLRAKAAEQITLNEAKLILVGEGEVGKTCLMDALLGNPWKEHDTTHGIEIKQFKVTDPDSGMEITLNSWDFGGQRVYRPTHQLFFSSPAVYLVVWKPREGPQQGFVKDWIKLVKHREPDAKILVVATHGGPQQRQPDIDRQELWDLFGKDTVLDFFHIESKPDKNDERCGIEELKLTIARVASSLPKMGRSVPKRWQDVRQVLKQTEDAYLPLKRVLRLCHKHNMDDYEARLFVTISHRLGHLIHYQHDPTLRDMVVLKPDWLATAISYVLDDKETRQNHGLVSTERFSKLWNDQTRNAEFRYPDLVHPIFLRLMERFDLSYRVTDKPSKGESDRASLVAQLVPDTRPGVDLEREWPSVVISGDIQQVQICRIVDEKGQSATAEGLFYQLIVRLHKYSLGRLDYNESVHWQRGLILDDDYNGRALLEHKGNDVHITVRAPYPERFLAMLTAEIKYLVESFWEGLRCDVMVPCIEPCGKNAPGTGLFEVGKLIDSKKRKRPEYPCPVCNEWQDIDCLLRNAPSAQPIAAEALFAEFDEIKLELGDVR